MSDAQLRQSDSASESVLETSLQLGIVITVTTRVGGESDYNRNGGNDSEDPSFDRYAGRRLLTVSLSDKVVKLAHEIITKGQFRDKKVQDRPENPDSSFSSITKRRGMLLKVSALLRGPCSASSGESTRSSTLWGRLERSRG